jgi:hypothetical protein
MSKRYRILYPHNLEHPGFELEPLVALQSEKTIVFLVKNHRIGGQLGLYGVVDYRQHEFWGWYPVFELAPGILRSMITAPLEKIYRIQNEWNKELEQWKMVEFKKVDLEETLKVIDKYQINFHCLKSPQGYLIKYGLMK